MNNAEEYESLVSRICRLKPGEEERLRTLLAQSPELQDRWKLDQRLNGLIVRLPEVELPSNFTARVMQEVRSSAQTRSSGSWRWQNLFRPKWAIASATLALGVTLFSMRERQERVQVDRAQSLAVVSDVAKPFVLPPMPPGFGNPTEAMAGAFSLDVLKDFDAIHRLGEIALDDETRLLLALQ